MLWRDEYINIKKKTKNYTKICKIKTLFYFQFCQFMLYPWIDSI